MSLKGKKIKLYFKNYIELKENIVERKYIEI